MLAYLYLTAGQNDAAIGELKIVTSLQPQDRVATQLLDSITRSTSPATAPVAGRHSGAAPGRPVPGSTRQPGALANQGSLEGSWTASPEPDTTITLKMTGNTYTWQVTSKGQSHQLSGQSNFWKRTLDLGAGPGRSPLVGQVTWQDANTFAFHALGGGAGDPGLTFRRVS